MNQNLCIFLKKHFRKTVYKNSGEPKFAHNVHSKLFFVIFVITEIHSKVIQSILDNRFCSFSLYI